MTDQELESRLKNLEDRVAALPHLLLPPSIREDLEAALLEEVALVMEEIARAESAAEVDHG